MEEFEKTYIKGLLLSNHCNISKSAKAAQKNRRAFWELIRKHHETVDVDGVRVPFPNGWGLVRASNTQPVLVMRFEQRLYIAHQLFPRYSRHQQSRRLRGGGGGVSTAKLEYLPLV